MKYYSLNDKTLSVDFGDALLASLAPDGGLWMPESIPFFTPQQTAEMGAMSFPDCAATLAQYFVDDRFSADDLSRICNDAYDYPMPIKALDGTILDAATPEVGQAYFLELFHGPTLAFKDFAARFMGRSASHLMSETGESRTILVATSGDTGGAIGDAFLNQPGITVFILYPRGGVSKVQEQQLTTMGREGCNIHAICVDGTFDDCQALVKEAFADQALSEEHRLMSANSINVGRVIPQSFYYFWSSLQIKAAHPKKPIVYSIPSGNLGNLTGGLIAKRMGAPIEKFVVGHNSNDPFVDYLKTGEYTPRPSVPTLSNAMDIGRPNNFPRILELYENDYERILSVCWGASYTDEETERCLRRTHAATGYVMCPHTTVGYLAMQDFTANADKHYTEVTVATAHPAKFADSVENILREDISLPEPLAKAFKKKQRKHIMPPTLKALSKHIEDVV